MCVVCPFERDERKLLGILFWTKSTFVRFVIFLSNNKKDVDKNIHLYGFCLNPFKNIFIYDETITKRIKWTRCEGKSVTETSFGGFEYIMNAKKKKSIKIQINNSLCLFISLNVDCCKSLKTISNIIFKNKAWQEQIMFGLENWTLTK